MAKPTKRSWKNADGSTGVSWRVQYIDASGNRRSQSFSRKTGPGGADEFCRQIERELSDGTHVPDRDSVTVAEAADIWLEAARLGRNGREPAERSTIDAYERHARLHIVPFLGAERLTKINTPRVVAFRDELLRNDRSRAMVKKILASLSAIFSEAKSRGLVGTNPAEKVSIVTSGRHEERVTIPEREEVKALIETARGWIEEPPRAETTRSNGRKTSQPRFTSDRARWFHALVLTLATTGIRLSEARGLAWDSVILDGESGSLEVCQRADQYQRIGPVKTGAARRRIELAPEVVETLEAWRWRCPAGPDDLVFPNLSGRVESQSNLYNRYWYLLLREAGLADRNTETGELEPRFGFHALRHFRASVLIASGADVKEIQGELGHANAQQTLDTYAHLFQSAETQARRRERAKSTYAEVFS